MTAYEVIVKENLKDLNILHPNGCLLQVAKSVSSPGGDPTFNVVYASKILNPTMKISWKLEENYGLNWSTESMPPGAEVACEGRWMPCALGASLLLDEYGRFQPVSSNPHADPNSLNVSSNDYEVAVNIIVGIQDPENTYNYIPIWVDPTQLAVKAHGELTPREAVQLWFQPNDQTGTRISYKETVDGTKDLANNQKWWFHYDAPNGVWYDQGAPFPPDDGKDE